jgi:hypothetical protein
MPRLNKYLDAIRAAVSGRRYIVLAHPDGAVRGICHDLVSAQAVPPLAIGSSSSPPGPTDGHWVGLGLPQDPTVTGVRAYHHALDEQAGRLAIAVDGYDPDGTAVVLGSPFYQRPEFAGREYVGCIQPEVAELGSDLRIDPFLAECGLPAIGGDVVSLDRASNAVAAHLRNDAGAGTRWSSCPADSFTFGEELVRVVHSAGEAAAAATTYRQSCQAVRVSRLPLGYRIAADCLSTPGGVRILEISYKHTITERASGSELVFSAGSHPAPQPPLQSALNEAVEIVQRQLLARFGFLGAFALEGVVEPGADKPVRWLGLSPYLTGNLIRLGGEIGFPTQLFVPLLSSENLPDIDGTALAEAARQHRLRRPRTSAWLSTDVSDLTLGKWWLVRDGDDWRLAVPDERPMAVAEVTSLNEGSREGRTRLEFSAAAVTDPLTTRSDILRCLAFLDDLLGLGIARRYVASGW